MQILSFILIFKLLHTQIVKLTHGNRSRSHRNISKAEAFC
jgi:hypothetical protein